MTIHFGLKIFRFLHVTEDLTRWRVVVYVSFENLSNAHGSAGRAFCNLGQVSLKWLLVKSNELEAYCQCSSPPTGSTFKKKKISLRRSMPSKCLYELLYFHSRHVKL